MLLNDDLDTYLNPVPRVPRRGTKLSPDQIASTLRAAGWDERHIPTMTAIAQAESSGNPDAHNAKYPDDSYGLLQVNRLAHPQYSPETLRDPLGNAKAALDVFKKQGLRAWSTYTNGAYKSHLSQHTSSPQKPTSDLGLYLDPQSSGQTPPPQTSEQRQQSPSIPVPPAKTTPVPSITAVLDRVTADVNRATRKLERRAARQPSQPARPVNPLFQQLGQQRTIDETQRQNETQARDEAKAELTSQRGPYGSPTLTGILNIAAHPLDSLTGIFTSDEDKISKMAAEKLHAQQLAAEPEVTSIRKEYGAMPAAGRAVVGPLARGGAGLLHTAGGIASAFGIAPNRLSDWANKRAEIVEAGAANTPLRESRNLNSLVTGNPQLEEIQRGIPEKVATGLADLGVGIGQIVLLQRATGLSLPKLLALEGAAKAADKPITQQLAAATEGYALGAALTSHLGRGASAALFGAPTAAQTGYEVSQGRMSPLDAAIQTGTQALTGAAMGGEGAGALFQRGGQHGPQTKAQSPVEAQREAVESVAPTTETIPTRSVVDRGDVQVESVPGSEFARAGASGANEQPQRFYHRDFGEVSESPSQRRVGKGRVRVTAEDGSEHVIKRASLTGAGNQRAVPIREPEPAVESAQPPIDQYLEPQGQSSSVTGFTTSQGSTYTVSGKSTQRTKAPHVGHDPNDVGLKPQSERTVYLDEDAAREVGMWNTLNASGKRIVIRGNEVWLTSINPKTGARGRDGRFEFSLDPEIGRSPLELRERSESLERQNMEGYRWNHPGTPIKEIQRSQGQPAEAPPTELITQPPATESPLPLQQKGESTTRVRSPGEVAREPLSATATKSPIVYRASSVPLDQMDIERTQIGSKGKGLYFAPSREGVETYAAAKGRPEDVKSATLDMRHPLDLTNAATVSKFINELEHLGRSDTLADAAALAKRWGRGGDTEALRRNVDSVVAASRAQPNHEYVRELLRDNPNLTALAKTLGYDGVIDNGEQVVFDRSQVRAVDGPRASIVTEPVTRESRRTAPKNAAMAADRAELGLPELKRVKGASAEQVLADAKQANVADPRRPDVLVEQALRGGRNFTDTETMQVNLRAVEIKSRVAELQREIAEVKDDAAIADKGAELDTLINEFDRLSQAQRKSGTEWGRAGIARQRAIDEDYSLVSMVAKFRKDTRRVETPVERAEIERLQARNAELEAKLIEAESRRADHRLQDEVNRTSRRQRRTKTAESLNGEFAQLQTQFAQARAETRNVQASGLAGLDPEGKLTALIAKMARNRIEAGVNKAEALVDEVYEAIKNHLPASVTKRDVRDAISGYSATPKTTRSETQKRLDALRSELQSLSKTEDVAAGKRSPRQEGPQGEFHRDQARQRAIEKELADLERRMSTGDLSDKPRREPPRYTRETARLQRELEQNRAKYARMRYKATRSTGGKITDELAKAANVPKTIKSIGDVSAMFRQGGYYAITHPIAGLAKPTRAMLQSFTDTGWRNVEAMIKADPAFEKLKQAGVEFTGVDKADPNLSRREEGYLGGEYLDYVPVAKQVKDFSERTFVSFLDAQRLHVGKTILDGMTEAQRNNPAEVKAVARLINIATGRGELGKRGNQLAPALNIAMFSPRLLASRVQLLNNMINPVTIARMPAGARKAMIADNVKFLAATGALLGLAKAAGATVSTDPDDAEFLKIRVGNTVYDTLTGLQQPLRYIANMGRAASPVDSRPLQAGPSMYSGRNMAEMSKQFARSKLNPALAPAIDFISGQDFEGRKFSAGRELRDLAVPLPAKDVYEGLRDGGIIGGLQATPTFVGIGVGSYPPAPDKPRTHAEKLARKLLREGMPPSEARDEDEIETDREKAQLRARSRAGESVNAELVKLIHEGKITDKQAKRVVQAKGRTRLSEDLKTLDPDESLRVYSVMSADEKRVSAASIRQKIANSKADAAKKAKFRERARELGLVQ